MANLSFLIVTTFIAVAICCNFVSSFLVTDLPPIPEDGGKLWIVLAAGLILHFVFSSIYVVFWLPILVLLAFREVADTLFVSYQKIFNVY